MRIYKALQPCSANSAFRNPQSAIEWAECRRDYIVCNTLRSRRFLVGPLFRSSLNFSWRMPDGSTSSFGCLRMGVLNSEQSERRLSPILSPIIFTAVCDECRWNYIVSKTTLRVRIPAAPFVLRGRSSIGRANVFHHSGRRNSFRVLSRCRCCVKVMIPAHSRRFFVS